MFLNIRETTASNRSYISRITVFIASSSLLSSCWEEVLYVLSLRIWQKKGIFQANYCSENDFPKKSTKLALSPCFFSCFSFKTVPLYPIHFPMLRNENELHYFYILKQEKMWKLYIFSCSKKMQETSLGGHFTKIILALKVWFSLLHSRTWQRWDLWGAHGYCGRKQVMEGQ